MWKNWVENIDEKEIRGYGSMYGYGCGDSAENN